MKLVYEYYDHRAIVTSDIKEVTDRGVIIHNLGNNSLIPWSKIYSLELDPEIVETTVEPPKRGRPRKSA